ncbi:TetR/AcrR family transcriptional regulator [Bifidobacterium saguinibicoloris]|uniref:TetR/AcrR family transcriptional regulator n=1 Tax=Bifidobacterium saguinibicoloris TaxID=2834433 RepID=UPI001C566AD6|nr:TetR/AcrR family transcriptional regulator [Bifidobacterium saguinibicoloris]MBW3080249.1 TetR/AcrR family transcriptional regulator [Bifidobacterium saguinibicoloris]
MPRPRRDSTIPPAKERMESAFWKLLGEREYRHITVTDIVRDAQVNRNSFYYHFSGLPELADAAILTEVRSSPLVQDVPDPDADPQLQWRKRITHFMNSPRERERLDRLALLAGPHSSPELIESLRDFVRMSLMQMLELTADDLDLKTDLTIDFSVGGLLAILRRWPELRQSVSMDDLLNEDIAVLAMGMYMSMSKENMLAYWNRIFNK